MKDYDTCDDCSEEPCICGLAGGDEVSEYLCLACVHAYEVGTGDSIRCPRCGSKERESLDVTDSDILEMLLASGAICCELLDAPGIVDATREGLADEFRRRLILNASTNNRR